MNRSTDMPEIWGIGSPQSWGHAARGEVLEMLKAEGALLLRALPHDTKEAEGIAAHVLKALSLNVLDYIYGSTPRTHVTLGTYTASEYPSNEAILQHSEMSYTRRWPRFLAFSCLQPAETGGETPVANLLEVTDNIDTDVIDEFSRKGVRYVRNYGLGIDLSWQDVFQTSSKDAVYKYCQKHEINAEWLTEGHLRTTQVSQGTILDTRSGQQIWFNQANLFHSARWPEAVRETMIEIVGQPENLPRIASFGDGTTIPASYIEHVDAAFSKFERKFSWKQGDCLILDNERYSHGRNRFSGTRRVYVSMASDDN